MPFKYIGKNKLLRTLKMQMNNPDIWYADILYYREEWGNTYRQEKVVYIDKDDIQYQIRNCYSKDERKTTLYYEIFEQVDFGNYRINQKKILKESENS